MGRNRSFDEAEVVSECARVFVHTGYEGTSIDDLVRATGLQRGSLYAAFGSKRGLFLAALTAGEHGSDFDLLLVALLELAPRDAEIRAVCARRIRELGGDAATTLGARMLERAAIDLTDTAGTTPATRKGQSA